MPRSAGDRDICASGEQRQSVIQHRQARAEARRAKVQILFRGLHPGQVALRLGRPLTATAATAVRAAIRAILSALTLLADRNGDC